MKAETDPITDDEWLLRRVRIEKFRTDKVPIISPNAFEPRIKGREPDTDGISLYRASCLTDPAEVLATVAPERRHEYGIVKIRASFIRSLHLSVQIAPAEGIKGHAVIPELNASSYQADKAAFTAVKYHLAVEASKNENLVRLPGEAGGP